MPLQGNVEIILLKITREHSLIYIYIYKIRCMDKSLQKNNISFKKKVDLVFMENVTKTKIIIISKH